MHIDQLELIAPDPIALRAFYGETLGLPVADRAQGSLEIIVGTTRLIFRRAPMIGSGRYHIAFNIPENQLNEAITWLKSRVPLKADPIHGGVYDFRNWNAHAVYFYDPVDNVLEFIARHDLPNATQAPFDSSHILCVSEIGLATDDVLALVEELRVKTGNDLYRPGSASFAPFGDEHGLFICVPRRREWFPNTGITADTLPVSATLRSAAGTPFHFRYPDAPKA